MNQILMTEAISMLRIYSGAAIDSYRVLNEETRMSIEACQSKERKAAKVLLKALTEEIPTDQDLDEACS